VRFEHKAVFLAPQDNDAATTETPDDYFPWEFYKTYGMWENIVREYSRTQLTNITDRLIALSGLAKRMKAMVNDDYVAGMWRNALPDQLFWHVLFPDPRSRASQDEPPRRSATYIAPTWSWASAAQEVTFHSATNETTEDFVVDVQLEYLSEDHTGAITSGYLDLKGWLRPVSFTRTVEDVDDADDPHSVIEISGQIGRPETPEDDYWTDSNDFRFTVDLDDYRHVSEADIETGSFHCLMSGAREDHALSSLRFLLLKVADQELGVYERIGTANLLWGDYDEDRESWQTLPREEKRKVYDDKVNRFKAPATGTPAPCRSFENGMYTVRII
jgi:hypothetical protein